MRLRVGLVLLLAIGGSLAGCLHPDPPSHGREGPRLAARYAVQAALLFQRFDDAGNLVDHRNVTFRGTSTWVPLEGAWGREDNLTFEREEARGNGTFREQGTLHLLSRLPESCAEPRASVAEIRSDAAAHREEVTYTPLVDLPCILLTGAEPPSHGWPRSSREVVEGKVRLLIEAASNVAGRRDVTVTLDPDGHGLPAQVNVRVQQSSPAISQPWTALYLADYRLEEMAPAGEAVGLPPADTALAPPGRPEPWKWSGPGALRTQAAAGLAAFGADDAASYALGHHEPLRAFIEEHPGAFVLEATYDEPRHEASVARSWSLTYGSLASPEVAHLTVSRIDGPQTSRVGVDAWEVKDGTRRLALARDSLPRELVPLDALTEALRVDARLSPAFLTNGTLHMEQTLVAVRMGAGLDGGLDPVSQAWRATDVFAMPRVTYVAHQGRGAWSAALDAETGRWAWKAHVQSSLSG
jgi:hypothetical protein